MVPLQAILEVAEPNKVCMRTYGHWVNTDIEGDCYDKVTDQYR